jgi:Na+-translocating ferredoxin:NAD+ oxidoreductase RNF subunit RnfB
MGHLTVKNYKSLYKRMDQNINGVFDSEEFYEILKILFTDEEALLCSVMPLLPSSCEKIAAIWETNEKETESILNTLVSKGLVYEDDFNGSTLYTLAIPIFGFFEFSLMRNDGMFDRKILSRLYNKYITEDDRFVRKYFGKNPPVSRTFVQEDTLSEDITTEILSYEKASHIIETAETISVGTCFCRHKMAHAGKACDNPQDVCLSFGNIATSLIEKGIAREVSKAEAMDIITLCIDKGLVQIGDNIKNKPAVICNCCKCCCELIRTYKKTGLSTIVTPSSYVSGIDSKLCNRCGLCIEKCPVDAISLIHNEMVVNADWCLGCGVCVHFCETNACKMQARPEKVPVPEDTLRKVVLSAIYQEKIGNFLFDNQKSLIHKISRNFINTLLKLSLIKRVLLKKSVQGRILAFALKKSNIENFNI